MARQRAELAAIPPAVELLGGFADREDPEAW